MSPGDLVMSRGRINDQEVGVVIEKRDSIPNTNLVNNNLITTSYQSVYYVLFPTRGKTGPWFEQELVSYNNEEKHQDKQENRG